LAAKRYHIPATMTPPQQIAIADFTYTLPDDRIAAFPLPERDASRLLVYQQGQISETLYRHIDTVLPPGCLLVCNNTKVINARLAFVKPTGGVVEVFCLEPMGAVAEYTTVMQQRGSAIWKCMVGGVGKWKSGPLAKTLALPGGEAVLEARLEAQLPDAYQVAFSWQPAHLSFAEILLAAGDVPLPPYIKRRAQGSDSERYQTVFAQWEGSVAAPTAGLHFTEAIFEKLAAKQIDREFVTLHVGAGTFKPVKAAQMEGHLMHAEWMEVSVAGVERLAAAGCPVAVGTTSLRTMESLYWLGAKALLQPGLATLQLGQWDVYGAPLANADVHVAEALGALAQWLRNKNLDKLFTQTQLLIAPGYRFRVAKALITNFHQPQSTLLLLVAAAVGQDWRRIYQYALENGFRFLSYGDGSLLWMADRPVN
jgi:S-adenosylmethionine:tRNA ribosyltransferase-isomerase